MGLAAVCFTGLLRGTEELILNMVLAHGKHLGSPHLLTAGSGQSLLGNGGGVPERQGVAGFGAVLVPGPGAAGAQDLLPEWPVL